MNQPSTETLQRTPGFEGRVIAPGDPDYEAARHVVYPAIDLRPTAIVRAASTGDVATTIRFAADSGLPLAVRSGGHSVAGHGTIEDGIVLDLRELRGIEIDPGSRTAWAGSGATTGEYTEAAGVHGLATGFGDAGTVGLGGITLGGGVGFLSRKHGLTIDSLLAAELVSADGELRLVDESNDPELFWALRGGGGNFGVVTRLRFRLHELAEFTGGMLLLPATPEVIAGAVAVAQEAPRELSAIFNVMPAPPMPMIPAEHHGKLIVMALLAYAGPEAEATRAIAPLRELAEPLHDAVTAQPYAAMFPPEDEDAPHPSAALSTVYADELGDATAETIIARLEQLPHGMGVVQLRALGGAIADVPAEATAYAHRDRGLMLSSAALYMEPEGQASSQEWAEGSAAMLRSGAPAAYVNFLADEGPERVREAYPGRTWERLTAVKARVDPGNLFRRNQNIPPAAEARQGAAAQAVAPASR
jgi:FAD/FMN-containing dehydrogenase